MLVNMILRTIATIILITTIQVESLKLPDYIKACHKSDPNLNECAKKSAIQALPRIVKGDRSVGIPVLDPLQVPLIAIKASENFELNLKDVVITGIGKMNIDDINIDLNEHSIEVKVSGDQLNLVGNYHIRGRIILLPIEGSGPAKITLENCTFIYKVLFDIVEKNGVKYYDNLRPTLKYHTGRTRYHLENLFNGDKRLGDEMNRFLNENYKEISKELSPTVSETINKLITSILSAMLPNIPADEIFLP